MTLKMIVDGGSVGNGRANSRAYGSFSYRETPGLPAPHIERLEYPELRTNNEAEMQTMIEALTYVLKNFQGEVASLHVQLWGDSKIAIKCLSGRWRIHKEHLKHFAREFAALAVKFKTVSLHWHPRYHSVTELGH